jgi:hypothetical protein
VFTLSKSRVLYCITCSLALLGQQHWSAAVVAFTSLVANIAVTVVTHNLLAASNLLVAKKLR